MGCAHLFLGSLFVLGEGSGGSEAGRVESRLAVSAVLANFRGSSENEHKLRLIEALQHAGQILHDRAQAGPAFQNSHAHCVAVLLRRGWLTAARVGDIRLDVLRGGEIRPVFTAITDARPRLGESADPEVETLEEDIQLEAGDRVLISNAALWDAIGAEDVARIASNLVPPVAARRLVEAADREGAKSPVSVQIVQVGEMLPDGQTPVADSKPARHEPSERRSVSSQSPASRSAQRRAVSTPVRAAPLTESFGARGSSSGLEWKWIIAILVVLGMGIFAIQRSFNSPSPKQYADRTSPAPERVDKTTFWDRARDRLGDRGRVLDPSEIRQWLTDADDRARVLREARAVVAVLETPPDSVISMVAGVDGADTIAAAGGDEPAPDPEPTDGGDGEELPGPDPVAAGDRKDESADEAGGELSADGGDGAGTDPAASAEEPTPRPPTASWDPSKLPPGLRGFETIFANADPLEGARALKAYVRRRHLRADKVLRSLDKYLELAPASRSLAVLTRVKETRPGPKTMRWARRRAAALQKKLGSSPR